MGRIDGEKMSFSVVCCSIRPFLLFFFRHFVKKTYLRADQRCRTYIADRDRIVFPSNYTPVHLCLLECIAARVNKNPTSICCIPLRMKLAEKSGRGNIATTTKSCRGRKLRCYQIMRFLLLPLQHSIRIKRNINFRFRTGG